MMKEMIITTENLTKTYQRQKSVSNLSLEIPKNEVYGLLGAERCREIDNLENDRGTHSTIGRSNFL